MTRKLFAVLAICLVCAFAFAGCAEPITGTHVRYDSLEDLSEAVGFEVLEPPVLPDGYVKSGYYCMEDQVAEILYMSGSNKIQYSMSKIKNVESDITDFDDMYITDINGNAVNLTLKDGFVVFGTVTIDDFTYSLYCPMGLSSGEFSAIAQYFGKSGEEAEAMMAEEAASAAERLAEESKQDAGEDNGFMPGESDETQAEENSGQMVISE